ncbi:MAG: AAA family ATPase [Prevotella sp.]|nr:AAA family ATPase [Prevotella sp.]
MSIDKKIQNYQYFFSDQVREAEMEQKSIIKAPMNQLFRKEEIIVGYVDHVNDNLGHVVIKFPKDKAPRLKVQKSIMVIKKEAKAELGPNVTSWVCSFLDFCKNTQYHSNTSDLLPLYYTNKGESKYDYIGCTGLSTTLYDLFKKSTESGKSLSVIVFSPFPLVDYFNNLVNFLEVYHDLPEQMIEPKIDYEDWQPEELEYNPENETAIPEKILQTLEEDDCCILQGPPGTGKSYTIAHIIATYLTNNKTVCVTTMANKGLIELVQQPPLLPFLQDGKISKSNLSADERRTVPGLKPIKKGFIIPNGELFCSTNYVLSQVYNSDNLSDDGLPSYDLIIIEEASQAFLASIIAFKKLGQKCLIVGDPMQLPPIISNPTKGLYNAWNANTQIEGLKTYALGTDVKSYRITTTFRLTKASADLTGIFYSNRFRSVQKKEIDFSLCHSNLFPSGGGVIYYYTHDFTNGIVSGTGLNIVNQVVNAFSRNYPKRSLAIISPFNDTVKQLQKSFLTDSSLDDFTIETIDRIQGMTVDYAILYIPGRNPSFALDERRFNVATSRSRSTTLIVSDIPLTNMHSISPKVANFIRKCQSLDDISVMDSKEPDNMFDVLERNDIKVLYPGMEAIVDLLIDNNIPFSHDGDVDLLDKDGVVIATAGMLLKEYNIAINPVDNDSRKIFERAGYNVIPSDEFSVELVKR